MKQRFALVLVLPLLAAVGCAGQIFSSDKSDSPSPSSSSRRAGVSVATAAKPPPASAPAPAKPGVSTSNPPAPRASTEQTSATTTDVARLAAIARERETTPEARNYPIGPGDVIEITVFDLAEMNRKERVSAKGDVQLPLVGVIHVEGLSESEVAQQIAAALAQRYLKQPQVNVFVKERRSQQVAVTGAVARPGLYPLTRESYTLTDMLSEAGGLTRDAGSIVEFIPAPRGGKSTAFNAAAADPIGGSARLSNPSALQEAISIDLNELMRSGNRAMLNLPVVANDVIFVPEAGTVTVEGWVDRPGTFPLTRNSTILAALASAGGTLIASKPSAIQLLRKTAPDRSEREVIVVDADAIRAGKAADLSLRSGDVVRVPPNVFLLPAWAIYSLVQNMFSVGANIPVIP